MKLEYNTAMTRVKPFFSIIIPSLNEDKYIPKLFNDFNIQSFKDFEVVVVDGGSSDKTVTEVKRFSKKISVTVLENHGKSVPGQRNRGAKASCGTYLVFFDADVRIPRNFLNKLHRRIIQKHELLFTTRLVCNNDSQKQIVLVEITNFIIETLNTLGKPFAPGFNIIIERSIFEKVNGFDETLKLAEDHDIVQRIRKMGVLLQVLKEPVLYPSFRRPEKIGYLEFLRQYVIAGIYTLTGEPIRKEIFDYPMGGHVYQNDSPDQPRDTFFQALKKRMQDMARTIELPF